MTAPGSLTSATIPAAPWSSTCTPADPVPFGAASALAKGCQTFPVAPTLAELADLVAARLAPHKSPRRLRVVDSLPRNGMGKILKRELGG
ncbi:hypothetical protein [Nocardiopsis metallicus]|uniref:Acyl-CoA synthetase (AMP-forming)/AMP-acid ligase II n=1 Tax=Nocardiopsis metallicus TaxID=179819 RepID=A0A840WFJ5_9ACTN|nr:hypothetical protein [Nocardiopsis metallicus]MBB5490725.1 acyl-CoA synthetase (AMP-forming)/AMP-acid ligase II [Nocardiopsis metallicus]